MKELKAAIAAKKRIMELELRCKDLTVKSGGLNVTVFGKDLRPNENMFGKPIYKAVGKLAPNYEVR